MLVSVVVRDKGDWKGQYNIEESDGRVLTAGVVDPTHMCPQICSLRFPLSDLKLSLARCLYTIVRYRIQYGNRAHSSKV